MGDTQCWRGCYQHLIEVLSKLLGDSWASSTLRQGDKKIVQAWQNAASSLQCVQGRFGSGRTQLLSFSFVPGEGGGEKGKVLLGTGNGRLVGPQHSGFHEVGIGQHRLLAACWLAACWLPAGCLLAACLLPAGCLLAACWLLTGWLAACWLSAGCLPVV